MNNLDKQYQSLLQDILDNGVEKKDRTGTGTISVFGRQIRHKMSEGFPLLTTKKMAWKTSMDIDGQLTKEEFINKCKTDTEFLEKWGLKIEEREVLNQVDVVPHFIHTN